MKVEMGFVKMIAALHVVLALTCAFAGGTDAPLLTLTEVQRIWNKRHDNKQNKFGLLGWVMDRMRVERMRRTNLDALTEIEAYLLDEICKIENATVDDYDQRSIEDVSGLEECLKKMAFWGCMSETNNLMTVAITLGRFKPLPTLDETDAMKLAWKVDDYLKYGTNKPPQHCGLPRSWDGPATEHVYKVSNFRREYNKRIAQMKAKILETYRNRIVDERDIDHEDLERQALWEEFVRVSGGLPKE